MRRRRSSRTRRTPPAGLRTRGSPTCGPGWRPRTRHPSDRPRRRPPSSRARTSSTCATGSPCWSTTAASSRTVATRTRARPGCRPTGWSPGAARSTGARSWSSPTTPPSRRGRGGPAPSRRSCVPRKPHCAKSFRSSGWSTAQAPGSPTRSRCSRGGGVPGGSSTTRSPCPARCRRSAACSARRRRAGPTSPASATSSSWSRATPRCTWGHRGWPRWSSARRSPSRRWAAPGCTAPSRVSATCSPTTTPRPSSSPGSTSRTCPAAGAPRCRPTTRRSRPSR